MTNFRHVPSRICTVISLGALLFGASGCASAAGISPATPNHEAAPSSTLPLDPALNALLPAAVRERGTVRIGVTSTGVPLSSKNGEQVVGLIPDLAREIGGILGVRVEYVETPFPGLLPALQSGRIDVAWSGMGTTKEREAAYDIVPFVTERFIFLLPKDNPANIRGLDDLCGTNAGSTRGAATVPWLEEQKRKCEAAGRESVNILLYEGADAGQLALRSGKIDSLFHTALISKHVAKTVDNGKAFGLSEESYSIGALAMIAGKGDPSMALALQGAMKKVVEAASYKDILEQYDAQDQALTPEQVEVNPAGKGLVG